MQNLHSTQDPAAFQPDEHVKNKCVSDSEDDRNDQKGNKKKGKQGQKTKAQTKATPLEENVKKTKQGKGKGMSKKCTYAQPSSTSTPPSSQGAQGQGTSTPPSSQGPPGLGTSMPTSIQGAQGQPTSTPSSTQGVQSSPFRPQVPDAHEKVIFDNFCFRSLDCLKLVHDDIDYCDLYMGNYYFNQLTSENVTILKQKGYWELILANWK